MLRTTALRLVLALVALTAMTWPAALHLGTHINGVPVDADVQAGLWWPSAFADALFAGRDPFFVKDFAWPVGQDTRLLLWNFLPQLLFAPLHALTAPVLGLNLAGLATVVLNALATGWAAQKATGSRTGALAGVLVGATSVYGWAEGQHGRPEQALWAPIAVYFGAMVDRRWALAGLALGLAGATYWFYAYFLVVGTAVWALVRRDRGVVTVAGVSALVALPFLWPVLSGFVEAPTAFEVVRDSNPDVIATQSKAVLSLPGAFAWPLDVGIRQPSQLAPLLLVPLCLWRRGVWGWIALAAALLACGPLAVRSGAEPWRVGGMPLALPLRVVDLLPGFSRFWWPYRFLGVATPAFGLVAAHVVAERPRLLAPLGLWLVVEGALGIRHAGPVLQEVRVPAVVKALSHAPEPSPVLQLPTGKLVNSAVGWQAFHHQPIDGGLALQVDALRHRLGLGGSRLQAMLDQAGGPDAAPPPPAWTEALTGGFHYVVLYSIDNPRLYRRRVQQLSTLLGPPFLVDDDAAGWALPGVSEPP